MKQRVSGKQGNRSKTFTELCEGLTTGQYFWMDGQKHRVTMIQSTKIVRGMELLLVKGQCIQVEG